MEHTHTQDEEQVVQACGTIVARLFVVVSKTMSNNDGEEQPFSEEQTKVLKSIMASAVTEALATEHKSVKEEQRKRGNTPPQSTGECIHGTSRPLQRH